MLMIDTLRKILGMDAENRWPPPGWRIGHRFPSWFLLWGISIIYIYSAQNCQYEDTLYISIPVLFTKNKV